MKKTNFLRSSFLLIILNIFSQQLLAQNIYIKDLFYKNNIELTDTNSLRYGKLNVFYSTKKLNPPTVIFIHGGGLTEGVKFLPQKYTDKQFIVVAPDYRLSPDSKCPTYIEDVAEAIAWTFKNVKKYGGSEKNIYLAGYSSGAYLAAMVFFNKEYLAKYDIDPDSLAGFFSISGQMTTHFQILRERGMKAGYDSPFTDEFAPLNHVRKTIPPATFFTGDSNMDLAGRFVQNTRMSFLLDSLGNKNVNFIGLKGKDHNTVLDTALMISCGQIDAIEINRSPNSIYPNNKSECKVIIRNKRLIVFSDEAIQKVSIYNVLGKKVLTESFKNDIDVSKLNEGIFLNYVETKDNTYVNKFLISKK